MSTKARLYEHNGMTRSIRSWARYYDLPYNSLRKRLIAGMSVSDAVAEIEQNRKKLCVEYEGREYTMAQLGRKFNLPTHIVYTRIFHLGWSVEKAVHSPRKQKHPPMVSTSGCTRYDCVHQDGSGVCSLGIKRNRENCEEYYDAYEYYYGNQVKWRKNGKDPWAAERKMLIG